MLTSSAMQAYMKQTTVEPYVCALLVVNELQSTRAIPRRGYSASNTIATRSRMNGTE